ncbi:WXG100 family type VII secretion target [Brachybacterium sp. AOP43-C2-M15]|uniref:WXG100 family type VII secretion target n=1 Tax=Brachybacterium sp. AOP43-C2-M15 TaxID=3457661 RepID=UPI004033556A
MKKGMTPESVEQMAQQIQDSSDRVQQTFQQVSSRVQEFDWTGEDRDRFVSEFSDTLGQLVQQVVQQLGDFSERGTRNAQQQREASS